MRMYIPKHFRVTDFVEIKHFIQRNSFGTIVTTEEGKPIATHLPLSCINKGMTTISLDISLMRIHSGKLSGMILFLLCIKGPMLIFHPRGTSLKMSPHGIIKLSMYMERLV